MSNKKWIQKANRRMKRKGTVGKFTQYCGGRVTDECVQKGLRSPDPKIRKRANFARNVRKMSAGGPLAQQLEFLGDGIDFSDGSPDISVSAESKGPLRDAIANFKANKKAEALAAGGKEGIKDALKGELGNLKESLKPSMGQVVNFASQALAKRAENKAGAVSMADPYRDNVMERKAAKRRGFGTGFKAAADSQVGQALGKVPVVGKGLQALAGVVGGVFGSKKASKQKEKDRKEAVKQLRTSQNAQLAAQQAQAKQFETSGETGFADVGSSITNSYLAQRGMRDGGVYDGKRLKGGKTEPLPGGAVEFVGRKHSEGGIMLDPQTEVEGGETMDKVQMKKGGKSDYIFSDYLKLGGKTFATRHKELLHGGASQKDIQELAKMQEKKARRTPKVMQFGGVTQYQEGGEKAAEEQKVPPGPREGEEEIQPGHPLYPEDAKEGERFYISSGELVRETLYDDGTAKRKSEVKDWSEGRKQSRTEEGSNLFSGHTASDAQRRIEKEAHWYTPPEGGFDPENEEHVEDFQRKYNAEVPEDQKIVVDGKWGDQTQSATIPQGPSQPKEVRREIEEKVIDPTPECECPDGTKSPDCCDKTPEDPGSSQEITEERTVKTKEVPTLATIGGLAQLIPPMYAFKTQPAYISGPGAASVVAPNMPRVNLNAERSANANDFRTVIASIEGNAGGPAGMVNMLTALDKKQGADREIANAENNANKELAAEEKRLKMAANETNARLGLEAGQFAATLAREQIKDRREEKLGALDAMADRLAGYAGDVLDYRAQERLASVIGADGVYERDLLRQQGYSKEEIDAVAKRRAEEKAAKDSETKAGTAAQAAEQAVEEKKEKVSGKDRRQNRKAAKKARGKKLSKRKVNKILEEERIAAEAARVKPASAEELGIETIEGTQGLRKGGYIRRAKRVRRKRRR